ncbi:uncharacterized protein LOC135697890 [Ochlerotatus camptorhynchus]|uniref:uncharacterized protein LOC135697890 n=1 Tax=Ochlerotatus camptorhynchus TaxID=644619 RepID=UPI0031D4CDD6
MNFFLKACIFCTMVAVGSAQFDLWFDNSESNPAVRRPKPPHGAAPLLPTIQKPPPVLASQAQEQRVVNFQNSSLERLFARSFKVDTAVEFQDAVVQLYIRSQRELDLCAEFLWETHLLKEYRRCAALTQRAIWRQVQVLKEDIRALTLADYEYVDY